MRSQVLRLGVGLLLLWPATMHAAGTSKLAERGKAVLQQNCARCHAIGTADDSPLKGAPPMRDIYGRFSSRELQAELTEGMVSKHKEMPQIEFSDEDVHAIMTYLYAIRVRR